MTAWTQRPANWGQPGHLDRSAEAEAVLDQISALTVAVGETSDWLNWTPTLTNITQGTGLVLARYIEVGPTVHYRFRFTFGASGSAMGTSPRITLPIAPGDYGSIPLGNVQILDSGTANYFGFAFFVSGSTVELAYVSATDVYSSITAAAPMVWAVNDVLSVAGTYEIA